MGKTLYLECYSGISGDMTVAALLDLGAREEALKEALEALPIKGYQIRMGRVKKCGIDAWNFDVILEDSHTHSHNHGSIPAESHSHGHDSTSAEPHVHSHDSIPTVPHTHSHSSYRQIMDMLDQAPLKPRVRALAQKIFCIVGQAEAQVHACPFEEVHFHEAGAVDSIVDIVGAAALAVDLDITDAYISPLYEGQGHVLSQHGRIPVPAPAVAAIAGMQELELKITQTQGEMVTPTGAAIAAALRTKKGLPSVFSIEKIGMGAGKKEFPHANLLRAMLIREASSPKFQDEIWVLETNLDDVTGETLGFAMEELFRAGARDVAYTPIYMKKNRPACRLEVLCKEEDVSTLEDIIFRHTTAIGLLKRRETRSILPREVITVSTPYGEGNVKICSTGQDWKIAPEYESVRELAQRTGKSYGEIYQRLVEEAWRIKENI